MKDIETKTYADGTTATGIAPLPGKSPVDLMPEIISFYHAGARHDFCDPIETEQVISALQAELEQVREQTRRETLEEAQPWQMPDAPGLLKFINETPVVQSLLYDINLLPEQIKDPVRWGYLVSLVSHYEMAVINAKTAQAQTQWQPIETAPKDGTPHVRGLHVHNSRGDFIYWEAHAGRINDETGAFEDIGGEHFGWDADDYTHWMPLPAAPSTPPMEPGQKGGVNGMG